MRYFGDFKYYKRSYCKYVLNGVLMIYWCSSQGVHTGFGTNYPKIKLFATDRRASLWKLQSWQPRRRLLWPNFGWWVWASLQQRRFFSATLLRLLVDGLRSAALLEEGCAKCGFFLHPHLTSTEKLLRKITTEEGRKLPSLWCSRLCYNKLLQKNIKFLMKLHKLLHILNGFF